MDQTFLVCYFGQTPAPDSCMHHAYQSESIAIVVNITTFLNCVAKCETLMCVDPGYNVTSDEARIIKAYSKVYKECSHKWNFSIYSFVKALQTLVQTGACSFTVCRLWCQTCVSMALHLDSPDANNSLKGNQNYVTTVEINKYAKSCCHKTTWAVVILMAPHHLLVGMSLVFSLPLCFEAILKKVPITLKKVPIMPFFFQRNALFSQLRTCIIYAINNFLIISQHHRRLNIVF